MFGAVAVRNVIITRDYLITTAEVLMVCVHDSLTLVISFGTPWPS